MSNKPREWPNVAKEARDLSAEAAVEGIFCLEPLVMRDIDMTEDERFRRISRAYASFYKILRNLESQGACTRPV